MEFRDEVSRGLTVTCQNPSQSIQPSTTRILHSDDPHARNITSSSYIHQRPYEISYKKPAICRQELPDTKLSYQHVFQLEKAICRLLVHLHVSELCFRVHICSFQTQSRCFNIPVSSESFILSASLAFGNGLQLIT